MSVTSPREKSMNGSPSPVSASSTSMDTSLDSSPMYSRIPSQRQSQTSLSSLDADMVAAESTTGVTDTKKETIDLNKLQEALADDEEIGSLYDAAGNEFEVPQFTMKDIRAAIPEHCFERSVTRSMSYVLRDVAFLAVNLTLCIKFITPEYVPSETVRGLLWAAYTVLQGCIATGLWVLAHECGHQAFSPYKVLNDTVGFICHSLLLVPYFAWKISHGKHHKNTGHIERDMVFVPKTRDLFASKIGKFAHELSELTEEAPIATFITCIGQQLLGWPLYISTNVTGTNFYAKRKDGRGKGKETGWFGGINHFNTGTPLVDEKDAKLILFGDIGLACTAALLYWLGTSYGWWNLTVWYFIPYLWVNHWLVAITYLQHTDPTLPHYENGAWNFQRGAAATIDRELGFVGPFFMHGIVETHVLHHFVSTIPFYNADEASEAIKPILGRHYRSKVGGGIWGFIKELYTNARACQWVEPCADAVGKGRQVLFYRNRNGVNIPPAKLPKPLVQAQS